MNDAKMDSLGDKLDAVEEARLAAIKAEAAKKVAKKTKAKKDEK